MNIRLTAGVALSAMLGACAGSGQSGRLTANGRETTQPLKLASPGRAMNARTGRIKTTGTPKKFNWQKPPVDKKWLSRFKKNPKDPSVVLEYVRNLRAEGANSQALTVLNQAYMSNPKNKKIASEYGRLVLAAGKLNLAQRLLTQSLDNNNPDPKVLSALGTIQAKLGNFDDAQKLYIRALRISPKSTSLMNNLGLAYALDAKPYKAEKILKRAAKFARGREAKRVRQNLSLVLSLQGKYSEATSMASSDVSKTSAVTNISYLKDMFGKPTFQSEPGEIQTPAPTAPATTGSIRTASNTKSTAKTLPPLSKKIEGRVVNNDSLDSADLTQLREAGIIPPRQ